MHHQCIQDYLKKDYELYKGRSYYLVREFIDDATGDPIDITGWLVTLTIKRDEEDPDADAVLIKDAYLEPEDGKAVIKIQANTLNGIDPDDYYYDISYRTDLDKVGLLQKGRSVIKDAIRRHVP